MWIAIAVLSLCARAAAASGSGPRLAEVLGWDATTQRVYVQVRHEGARGGAVDVFYYDLQSAQPARVHRLGALKGEEVLTAETSRTDALRRGLRPLREIDVTYQTAFLGGAPSGVADTVYTPDGVQPRYIYSMRLVNHCVPSLRVLVWRSSPNAVRELARYALPNTSARLVIFSCEGGPDEAADQIQFPALFGEGCGTADPIDPRTFRGDL